MPTIKEQAYIAGVVFPQLAKRLKNAEIPQQSRRWYTEWPDTGRIWLHRSFNDANRYFRKYLVSLSEGEPDLELFAAFTLSDLNRLLMPVWDNFSHPYPIKEENVWYWVLPEMNIKEVNEACAKGELILYLLENQKIKLEDLYFSDNQTVVD